VSDDLVVTAPDSFGPYRQQQILGRGSLATVWRAFDGRRERTVALKRFDSPWAEDPRFQKRFRDVMQAVGRLGSGHILPVHDFDEFEGQLFVDMRLVEGGDLHTTIAAHPGGLPTDRALEIGRQIAAALDVAHGAGLVHGHLTPANVLLEPAEPHDFCYVADFGVARAAAADETDPDDVAAATPYSPPEFFRGDPVTPAWDVYALGCLLFELLTGRPSFTGPPFELMDQHLFAEPPRPSRVRTDLAVFDSVFTTALAKAPDRRYSSAGALIEAATKASAPDGSADAVAWWRRRTTLISAAVVLVVMLLGIAFLVVPVGRRGDVAAGPTPAPPPAPPVAFHLQAGLASTGDIAVSSDGQTLFTLRTGTDGALTIVDVPTATVRNVVPVGTNPEDVAVSPDGSHAYVVVNGAQGTPGKTVSVVDTAADRVVATVPVGNFPNAVKVSPDGRRVYAANSGTIADGGGGMTTIDATTNTVLGTLPIRPVPNHFAVSPDGRYLYVPDGSSTSTPGAAVSVVDTATNSVVRTFPVGIAPRATAVSPDGRHVWVAAAGDSKDSPRGALNSIDLATGQVDTIAPQVVKNPRGVAVSPDGSTVVVTDNGAPNAGAVPDNAVLVLDAATGTVRRSVIIGGEPKQIAFSPDSHDAFISAMGPGDVWRIPLGS
jgi:YVTN family beta-propeller protein